MSSHQRCCPYPDTQSTHIHISLPTHTFTCITYACIHSYICMTYTTIHIYRIMFFCMHIYIKIQMYNLIHAWVSTYIHTYLNIYISVCLDAYISPCKGHICMHALIHIYIHTNSCMSVYHHWHMLS